MFKLHRLLHASLLATGLLQAANAGTEASHKEILARCDVARGNIGGVEWEVTLSEESGGSTEQRRIHVRADGFDMLAETLSPPRQKGHKLLLVQNNMWFYKPGLSKPVPVSLRQKLAGRAANGDIASTNYAEDYEIESVEDGEHEGEPCYLFHLKAVTPSVTYARIDYWVSKQRSLGLRADYYNTNGSKRLKTATMRYANEVTIDGDLQPFISEMKIRDDLDATALTRLTFSSPVLEPIPARVFSLQALSR